MTAKRLMLLSLLMSVVGLSILLLTQSNKATTSAAPSGVKLNSKVLVSTRTIEVGQSYSPNMFRWKELPHGELADYIDYVTPEDIKSVNLVSGIARSKLTKGQVLSLADIVEPSTGYSLSLKLQSGFRAISVPVDSVTANSGFIQPGDRVDILLLASKDGELMRMGNSSQGLYVTTIANDVRVLAFNDAQSAESYQQARARDSHEDGRLPDDSTVSLEVSPNQANQIVLAKQLGKLTLALRSQNKSSVEEKQVDAATIDTISPGNAQVLPDVGLVEFRASKKQINNKTGADNNG